MDVSSQSLDLSPTRGVQVPSWVQHLSSRGGSCSLYLNAPIFYAAAAAAKSLQSCPTLNNPRDCSPPGSSIHGIFQARVLEWGAIAFSEPSLIIASQSLITPKFHLFILYIKLALFKLLCDFCLPVGLYYIHQKQQKT